VGFLANVKEGKTKQSLFCLVYGVPGVGKSTLGSEAPKPLFFGDQAESGQFNVKSGPEPKTVQEIRDALNEMIQAETLDFKTLIFDSLGWFEPIVWKEVCKQENKKTIDDIGWQNGYKMSLGRHLEIIELLKELRRKHKIDIFVLGHSKVKTFQDPSISSSYDQYMLSIHEEAANAWTRSVDMVLFMNFEVLKKDDKDKFAQGEGIRLMYTQERPAFKAKNRFGLPFKMVMPKGESYKTLLAAIAKGEPDSVETLVSEIKGLLESVKDEALIKKVTEALEVAKKDAVKLTAIKDRLIAVIGGVK
jgi:AAA domain